MRVRTLRDLGAVVRSTRKERGLTQAALAERVGVSRDWVVRLERGHPRLEAQRVFDVVSALGLAMDLNDAPPDPDPFSALQGEP